MVWYQNGLACHKLCGHGNTGKFTNFPFGTATKVGFTYVWLLWYVLGLVLKLTTVESAPLWLWIPVGYRMMYKSRVSYAEKVFGGSIH